METKVFTLIVIILLCVGTTSNTNVAFIQLEDDLIMASSCQGQANVKATVTTEIYAIELSLVMISENNAPVYVERRDVSGINRIQPAIVLHSEFSVEYQDKQHFASVEITCRHNSISQLIGCVTLPDGKFYSLEMKGRGKRSPSASLALNGQDTANSSVSTTRDQETSGTQNRDDDIDLNPKESVFIDVLVLVEYSVYQKWFKRSTLSNEDLKRSEAMQNIRRHFAFILNTVDQRFKTISDRYNFRLIGFLIEDSEPGEWLTRVLEREGFPNGTKVNGVRLLEEMGLWISGIEDFPEYDHILAWTEYDMYMESNNTAQDLYGISYIGSTCSNKTQSISVVEYRGKMTDDTLVAVHEVAHGLGAYHDGEEGNTCSGNDSYIMKNIYSDFHSLQNNNQYTFSVCSAAYFQFHVNEIIARRQTNRENYSCLVDKLPIRTVVNVSGELPGQLYDVDLQCQMFYGEASYYCRSLLAETKVSNICKRMYCHNPADTLCYPLNAAEGTSCGNKQWCKNGECVQSQDAPEKHLQCMFGDIPGPMYKNKNCTEFITAFFAPLCYSPGTYRYCCDTCSLFRSNDTECEYGDNYFNTTCSLDQCASREGTYYVDVCCETCKEYRRSSTSTLAPSTTFIPTSISSMSISPSTTTSTSSLTPTLTPTPSTGSTTASTTASTIQSTLITTTTINTTTTMTTTLENLTLQSSLMSTRISPTSTKNSEISISPTEPTPSIDVSLTIERTTTTTDDMLSSITDDTTIISETTESETTESETTQSETTQSETTQSETTQSASQPTVTCFDDVTSDCNTTIPANPSLCYKPLIQSKCCASCRQMSTGKTGCEYGDKSPSTCEERNGQSCCGYVAECCEICSDVTIVCSGGQNIHGTLEILMTVTILMLFRIEY